MDDYIDELRREIQTLKAINRELIAPSIVPKYGVILADPPWPFKSNGREQKEYPTLPIAEIKGLSVPRYCEENCALFLWVTWPFLREGLDVLEAWGFRYATQAFTWAKRSRQNKAWHFGQGYYTRSNSEICLLGIKGKMTPVDHAIRSLIVAPIGKHSVKPREVYENIEKLFPAAKKLELFSRRRRDGWHSWGNEVASEIRL